MQTVKYQIFVSSTYVDLIAERDQIIKAVLEMGHIPVGMEMFSAADEEQWKIIARQIDQSDYYVVIVAHRYGSITNGISYTEKEYDYAVQQGIPVIGFVIDDKAPWPNDRVEDDPKKKKALSKFKAKVKSKPVGFWSTAKDLYGSFSIAFMKLFNTNPRPGWVRTTEIGGPEVLAELSRLSSENAELRATVADLQKVPDTAHLAQGEDKIAIKLYRGREYITDVPVSWNQIFRVIGHAIIRNPDEDFLTGVFNEFIIEEFLKAGIHADHPTSNPGGTTSDRARLNVKNELESVKVQLMALRLIEIEHVNAGVNRYTAGFSENTFAKHWLLTSLGKRTIAELLAIRRPG
jgi:hypothetical protein